MSHTLGKDKVPALFGALGDFDVYGPVEEDGVVRYRLLDSAPYLDFGNSRVPPKSVFFPQTETMFDLVREGNRFVGTEEPERSVRPLIVFGARPCDARAMTILDSLFSWDYVDPYYMDRRETATTIALTCTGAKPDGDCFCTSIGGSPSGTEGVDMLWTDLGDRYLVESLTDRGDALIEIGSDIFVEAVTDDEDAAVEVKDRSEKAVTRTFDRSEVVDALKCLFDSRYWDDISDSCLGCGICTLLCPTCHCFDINDVVKKGEGRRERTWDTCQSEYYSVHASGHNPRPAKKHRQRNRLYHKFLYMDENLGVIGCVGCGRCIAQCPVGIDIIEVAEGAVGAAKADDVKEGA